MFNSGEIEAIPIALEQHFKDLEMRIMLDIIKRIKINGEITRSSDWQIKRLEQLGVAKKEIKSYIKATLKLSDKEIDNLYDKVIKSGYARDEKIYASLGKPSIPFSKNEPLKQLIYAVKIQTMDDLKNITQSLGFAVRKGNGLIFTPIADYYQKTLDSAMLDITTGAFDYNTVIKRTVNEMVNSGLRTVDYASGWINRTPVAARRAIMTGVSQVTSKINDDNAKQLETEHFEVSWHGGARPSHQLWQGRVYSRQELQTICGLGVVTGLCGANCYHAYFPFIMGISQRTYTDEQLDEMNRKENIPFEYKGKKYTKYEALQKQRVLETTMRAQRQKIKLLKEGQADLKDIKAAKARYLGTSAEYTRFSEIMNLPQQRERVMIDGLGNIGT